MMFKSCNRLSNLYSSIVFIFLLKIILFIYIWLAFALSRGYSLAVFDAQASRCGVFSYCGAQALGLSGIHGCRPWAH